MKQTDKVSNKSSKKRVQSKTDRRDQYGVVHKEKFEQLLDDAVFGAAKSAKKK